MVIDCRLELQGTAQVAVRGCDDQSRVRRSTVLDGGKRLAAGEWDHVPQGTYIRRGEVR